MSTDRGHVTRMTIPLRNRDVDVLGHLNQSVYHVFLEEVRTRVLQEVLQSELVGFVLARVELDHRHEVRMADREVRAEGWLGRVGRSSVEVRNRITVGDDDRVAAEATTILVGWDHDRRASRPLTDDERGLLLAAGGTAS